MNRDIQGRDTFIGHHKTGVGDQRARDRDALPLASGEGMGKAAQMLDVEAAFAGNLANPLVRFILTVGEFHNFERLGDDVPDGHPWTQSGIRILEYQLCLATERQHILLGQSVDIELFLSIMEDDLARGDGSRLQNGATQCRFARTAFSDQAKKLAPLNLQIDIVERTNDWSWAEPASRYRVMRGQIANRNNALAHGAAFSVRSSSANSTAKQATA